MTHLSSLVRKMSTLPHIVFVREDTGYIIIFKKSSFLQQKFGRPDLMYSSLVHKMSAMDKPPFQTEDILYGQPLRQAKT